jgi:hypothetical protein
MGTIGNFKNNIFWVTSVFVLSILFEIIVIANSFDLMHIILPDRNPR